MTIWAEFGLLVYKQIT